LCDSIFARQGISIGISSYKTFRLAVFVRNVDATATIRKHNAQWCATTHYIGIETSLRPCLLQTAKAQKQQKNCDFSHNPPITIKDLQKYNKKPKPSISKHFPAAFLNFTFMKHLTKNNMMVIIYN